MSGEFEWRRIGDVAVTFRFHQLVSMTMSEKLVWTLPWAVKLLLTILVGGALSVGTYLFNRYVFSIEYRIRVDDGVFILGYVVFWQVLVGTSLYRFEKKPWRSSIIKGLVLGLVGSAVITTAGILFGIWIMSVALH